MGKWAESNKRRETFLRFLFRLFYNLQKNAKITNTVDFANHVVVLKDDGGDGSKTGSRRNSQIDMRRQSMRHVEPPAEGKNSLKVRRNSNSRRTSLADCIPDWPTLSKRKTAAKVI